jgi:hypothetical protein
LYNVFEITLCLKKFFSKPKKCVKTETDEITLEGQTTMILRRVENEKMSWEENEKVKRV